MIRNPNDRAGTRHGGRGPRPSAALIGSPCKTCFADPLRVEEGIRLVPSGGRLTNDVLTLATREGASADNIIQRGLLESEVSFLQKPFTAEALLSIVREVLDASTDAVLGAGSAEAFPR